ncbi:hypothetical protein [Streptomyces niveiscabiei]|uniref:Uncharacterized protein n=1 Tax=Streptomyces niveiscabiei TaxID=164115 RepID=A0ABW9HQY4_9ACTN
MDTSQLAEENRRKPTERVAEAIVAGIDGRRFLICPDTSPSARETGDSTWPFGERLPKILFPSSLRRPPRCRLLSLTRPDGDG